jgi:hypothetical protein
LVCAWWGVGGGGVEPLTPTVETIPARHMAVTVSARSRLGVSQEKPCVCSQVRKPLAAEAAAIAQTTHMLQTVADEREPGVTTRAVGRVLSLTIIRLNLMIS